MRGKQVKELRRLAKVLHAILVAKQEIPTPESEEEVAHQRKKLLAILKSRWNTISRPKSMSLEIRSLNLTGS